MSPKHNPIPTAALPIPVAVTVPSSPTISAISAISLDCPEVADALPPAIPVAREAQHEQLLNLLQTALSRPHQSSAVYVCGTPGTGKTLTVKTVLRTMQSTQQEHNQIFINCASISSPTHLLNVLVESLHLPKSADPAATLRNFASSPGRAVLVVVDEIDLLVSQGNSAALYALFEIPALSRSRLCVLAIANAIDLQTRLLPWLSNCAARPTHITFRPYDATALAQMARAGVAGCTQWLPPVALLLGAKKVAAAGGDARLMHDVCRQTIACLRRGDGRSALSIMMSVATCKGAAAKAVATIAALPTQQQIAVCVAANAALFSDRQTATARPRARAQPACMKRATLGGLYESFKRMCERVHVAVVEFDAFADFCCGALTQHALMDVTSKVRGKSVCTMAARPVRLRVTIDDVRAGVGDKAFLLKLVSK